MILLEIAFLVLVCKISLYLAIAIAGIGIFLRALWTVRADVVEVIAAGIAWPFQLAGDVGRNGMEILKTAAGYCKAIAILAVIVFILGLPMLALLFFLSFYQ